MFGLCRKCDKVASDEKNTDIDIKHFGNVTVKESPFIVKSSAPLNSKPNFTTTLMSETGNNMKSLPVETLNINQELGNNKKEDDEESEFDIIEYPYEPSQPNVNKIATEPHPPSVQSGLAELKTAGADKCNDLDYTLIDDFSENKSRSDKGAADAKSDSKYLNSKVCIYCEGIYKEAYQKGYKIQEKPCINCNKMITQETFDELFKKDKKNDSKDLKKKVSLNKNLKSRSSNLFKSAKDKKTTPKGSFTKKKTTTYQKSGKTSLPVNTSTSSTERKSLKDMVLSKVRMVKMKTSSNLKVNPNI